MSDRRRLVLRSVVLATLALLVPGTGASSQVVRGTVTERGSGEPLAGVLVTLESVALAGEGTSRSVLTDEAGAYAIRTTPGQFRITAKRIGVQRYFSDPFTIAPGETRELNIETEALVFELPAVRILDAGLCVIRDDERQRISALWDEARTALTATSLSQRDRLFQGTITRYSRRLDPRSLAVLEDSWSESGGMYDRTFISPSGDSLSRFGYWRVKGTETTYYAPDGNVLLSRAFQKDHCFIIVPGQGDRDGMIGLGFTPVAARKIPDVRGALWMDSRTFALQFVDFAYTQLPESALSETIGGQLRFSRLANGAWVTSRWYLRMPEYIAGTDTRAPVLMTRAVIRTLFEEGGMAFGPGLRHFTAPASITGTLTDSMGRSVPGVRVRLGGTPYTTATDSSGWFQLDSLPGGYFTLMAEMPGYQALGTPAAEAGLDLREGVSSRVSLRARNTAQVAERLCPGQRPRRDRAVVRVGAVDRLTGKSLPNLGLWLRWPGERSGADNRIGEELRTDQQGGAVFCDVPAGVALTISAVNALGQAAGDSIVLRVAGASVTGAELRTRRP